MTALVFFALGYALTGAVLALLRLALALVLVPLRWMRGRPRAAAAAAALALLASGAPVVACDEHSETEAYFRELRAEEAKARHGAQEWAAETRRRAAEAWARMQATQAEAERRQREAGR